MDMIKFTVEDFVSSEPFPLPSRFPAINIYINGQNLLDLVLEVEQANRVLRGAKPVESKSSSYAGLSAHHWHTVEYFMGGPRWTGEDPVHPFRWILGCTCTYPDCWGVGVAICPQDQYIIWTNLKNPWLASHEEPWTGFDYSLLSQFVFDRQQYEQALMEIKDWLS